MPWAVAAAAVAAGGAAYSADQSRKAAGEQSNAARMSEAEMRRQFNLSREDTRPWRITGETALDRLSLGMGLPTLGAQGSRRLADGRTVREATIEKINAEVARMNAAIKTSRAPNGALLQDRGYNAPFEQQGAQDQETLLKQFMPAVLKENELAPAGPGEGGEGDLVRKFTMDDFLTDPVSKASFDFGLSEGEKAVRRMFGSRGMSRSGAAVKAATRFGADYANTKAGESRDRFVQDQTNLYNRLAGVSGTGQVTATNNASNAMTMGSNVGQLIVGAGNARGAATIAQGNAWNNAAGNTANSIQSAYWLNRAYPQQQPNPEQSSNFYYTGDTAAGGRQYGG